MATPRSRLVTTEPPRVGETLARLRAAQGYSLDELSRRAGVSKSMLSQIERGQANPTVAVVWRLANALGTGLAELIEGERPAPAAISVMTAPATPTLRQADGSHELRILGPIETAGQFEWYVLTLQPGAALTSAAHEPGSWEHLTVLAGSAEVRSGDDTERVKHGETARYPVDRPHSITNPGKTVATALLVVLHSA